MNRYRISIDVGGMMLPAGPIIEKKPSGLFGFPNPPIVQECDVRRIVTDVQSRRGLGQIDSMLLWRILEINSESP